MSAHRTDGGATKYAVSRLVNQFGFQGTIKDGKNLFRACCKVAKRLNDTAVVVSSRNLKGTRITDDLLKKWNVEDGTMVVLIGKTNGRYSAYNVLDSVKFQKLR